MNILKRIKWFFKKPSGTYYFYTDFRCKICKVTNGYTNLVWCDYGSCATMRIRMNFDGTISAACKNCSRLKECNKPYGRWKWSDKKPSTLC